MFTLPAFAMAASRDAYGFLRAHFPGKEKIPKDKILTDSHFHIGRGLFQSEEDYHALLHSFFTSDVSMQTISDYGLVHSIGHVVPYEEFMSVLPRVRGIEVLFSDQYATVARRGNKTMVFSRGIEVETILEGSIPALFRENHQIHIAAEGFDHLHAAGTYEVLEAGKKQGAHMTIAHPFTIPAGKTSLPLVRQLTAFLPPNLDEISHIYRICKDFPVYLERLNGGNSLWMTPTNSAVAVFAQKHNIPIICNSDSHTRPSPPLLQRHGVSKYWLFQQQLGSAGTLIPKETGEDLETLTGKEILEKKYEAIRYKGERYGNVSNTWVFALSVAATHLEFLTQ